MAKLETISEKVVADLPVPGKGNVLHYASGLSLQGKKAPAGFAVRVTAAGTKSFVWFHRVDGRPHLDTLGRWDENAKGGSLTVRDAIIAAQKRAKEVRDGDADPRPARTRRQQDGDRQGSRTVSDVLDLFIERYAKPSLRSADQYESTFDRLVKPEIGDIGIGDLRRSHVVDMLDEIEDESGPVMADRALAYVRKALNWYASRDDEFRTPIVKGMSRTKAKERAGRRILADDEIRDVWAALGSVTEPACYGNYVRFLFLTATRRNEAANMQTVEIDGDLWIIPADRYKTKLDHAVPLTAAARALIGDKPEGFKGNNWYVFSTTGGTKPFAGFSKAKAALDAAIHEARAKAGLEPMPRWRLHDLRRTARSLMSRAKVPADHAERALGHVIGGVRETYDRHEYAEEKRAAFEALAVLLDRIINPPAANVTVLAEARC